LNVYITHTDYSIPNKRELFLFARPFFKEGQWIDNPEEKAKWGLDSNFTLVNTMAEADFVIIPFSINHYLAEEKINDLEFIQRECIKYNKKAYAHVAWDFGIAFPEFSRITYFRMSGFQSQLSDNNKGFPVALSDHFQRIFKKETITPSSKEDLPIVGFCGHATFSNVKRLKEITKCVIENIRRFFQNPFRKDWETLFASAYERANLLKFFEKSDLIKTNFIYRQNYRAGAQTKSQREQTTLEYYNNIANSDYILCVRGAGNFSVRFYETLMMGKIPIFVNTDCLLPFEDKINWKEHVIWVEWKDRQNITQIVSDFHQNIRNDDFMQIQLDNRDLWKNTLSVKNMLTLLKPL
jgi:hypothetical protein